MQSNVTTYQPEIFNEPFHGAVRPCDKTVLVKTYIENKLVSEIRYGWVSPEEVYEQLKKDENINLSNCYIKDFSISGFKKSIGLDELDHFECADFIAENAFFDCTLATDFSYINFKGVTKFNNTVFSHGNLSFYHSQFTADSDVEFIETRFGNGDINFHYVDFGKGKVLFSSSRFYGGVASFISADFNDGDALFNDVDFYNVKVKFHYAKFGKGGVNFQKSKFGNRTVDFRKVEFGSGRVDFRRAIFGNCYITFDEAEMTSGKFNFRSARFGNNDMSFKLMNFGKAGVLFENVNFGTGQVSFADSTSSYLSFKGSRLDVFLDLSVKRADVIDLSDTILRDIIDLKPVSHEANVKILYLNGMRNLGRIIIDWKKNKVKALIKSQQDTTLRQKSEQFNILKEDFHLSGQYEDEDKAYIQFKRYELRADYERAITKKGTYLLNIPNYGFRWLVFDKMGLYATSPLRVLWSMIVVYVLFSLLYLVIPLANAGNLINSVGATDGLIYFQTCFYHSAITFLTIGYGDYYPTGFNRGISIVEGWMGLFLMSYFTVAFVRKILR